MKQNFFQRWLGGSLMGAAFLMATSAIGPGFITQTTVFTKQLGADFGFVILISILIDIVVQLNIWKIIAATGLKAPDLANKVVPGSGYILTMLVVLGGIVFNVGNVAGCGLGLQTLANVDTKTGAMLSGILAIVIFLVKEFGKAMDSFAKWLGILMIAMVLVVAFGTQPSVGQMVSHTVMPQQINTMAILTLVGGTVGGYISFAGAHRMLDAGKTQVSMPQVNRSAVSGIVISGIMRICLFAAAFGVIATGFVPDAANPAASIFKAALGDLGQRVFGVILWCAAITSVVGASYTSVSFLESLNPFILRFRQWFIVGFIALSTMIFALFGKPVKILVTAGAINGLILPLALALILLAASKKGLLKNYKHPQWLSVCGWLVVLLVSYMCWQSFTAIFN